MPYHVVTYTFKPVPCVKVFTYETLNQGCLGFHFYLYLCIALKMFPPRFCVFEERFLLGDEQLASLACTRPRMSVCLCLDYSSLALGEGTSWTLGASMTGSMSADLA